MRCVRPPAHLLILQLLTPAACFTPKLSSHCVRWSQDDSPSPIPTEGAGGVAPQADDRAGGPILCRPRGEADDTATNTCGVSAAAIGKASTHLDVGVLAPDGACVPLSLPMPDGAADLAGSLDVAQAVVAGGEVQYAVVHPECDVWWREVSEDVIPPIPELILPFGQTARGDKLALCRTFGDGAKGDGGLARVGTIALEGVDFGKCFFTQADGETREIDGGTFHILQARPAAVACVDNAADGAKLAGELRDRISRFISEEHRASIARVAGAAFEALSEGLAKEGSCALQQVRNVGGGGAGEGWWGRAGEGWWGGAGEGWWSGAGEGWWGGREDDNRPTTHRPYNPIRPSAQLLHHPIRPTAQPSHHPSRPTALPPHYTLHLHRCSHPLALSLTHSTRSVSIC